MSRFRASFILVCLGAGTALATPTYPAVIQSHLALPAAPPQSCGLCHLNNVVGTGTVTTPFGASLRMRGLLANDEASLRAALDALRSDAVDSDGDGQPDLDELAAGGDPNQPGASGPELRPRYGCGASSVPGWFGSLALLPLWRRRRARDA